MSGLIGKTCGGCKHFARKEEPLDSECRAHPPETRILFLGVGTNGKPVFHREAGYAVTRDKLDACGEYMPRLAASELN